MTRLTPLHSRLSPLRSIYNGSRGKNTPQNGSNLVNKNIICYRCGGAGHFQNECPSKPMGRGSHVHKSTLNADLKKYVEEWDQFVGFNPKLDKKSTNILKSLKCATIEPCSDSGTINVLKSSQCVGTDQEELSPNVIFVRNFYDSLLQKIRKYRRTVLIGNPGIGKSWFQWYYLARLANSTLLHKFPLPPDCFKNRKPPKVVIRQEGLGMVVYFLELNEAYSLNQGRDFLRCFDPKISLYLFEPGETKIEPFFSGLDIPIHADVSPDINRYKEFCKNGGVKLYMPTWNLEELKTIGHYLRENHPFSNQLREYYSDDKIEEQFQKFGGILRHVFPVNPEYSEMLMKIRTREVEKVDCNALITRNMDIEDPDVSHLLLQYEVTTEGPKAFTEYKMKWVSSQAKTEVEGRFSSLTLKQKVQKLIRVDKGESDNLNVCPKLFEEVIAEQLQAGVEWRERKNVIDRKKMTTGPECYSSFSLKLPSEICRKVEIGKMKENTLYYPEKKEYLLFDMMYIKKIDEPPGRLLTGIQVTAKGKKEYAAKTFESWKKEMCINLEECVVDFVLCPHPKYSDEAEVAFYQEVGSTDEGKEKKKTSNKRDNLLDKEGKPVFRRVQVWQIPEDYSQNCN